MARFGKSPVKLQVLQKPTCTSCRKARKLLEGQGCEIQFRDLDKQRLSASELDHLIGERDYRKFLNPRNQLYRKHKMGQKPPSRAQAVKLMAREPNLIRRPVVLRGSRIVLGYDPEALKQIAR